MLLLISSFGFMRPIQPVPQHNILFALAIRCEVGRSTLCCLLLFRMCAVCIIMQLLFALVSFDGEDMRHDGMGMMVPLVLI